MNSLPFEMIDLMLQRDREQIVCFDFDFFLIGSPRAHQHARRALDVRRIVDHGQAALFPNDFSLGLDDARVNQLEQILARLIVIGIEHDDPLDAPTCGAARPTPGAEYIVCAMLSMSALILPSIFSIGSATVLSDSSGNFRIFNSAI